MKFKTTIFSIAIICVVITLSRCYYDSEEFLYPEILACDTSQASFETDIQPIFQTYCLLCHGETTAAQQGTFKLVTYDQIMLHMDRMVGAVNHDFGYVAMPLDMPKLGKCQIALFNSWVNAGSPQN